MMGPDPHLEDEENDMTERYEETGDATDVGMDIPAEEEIEQAEEAIEDIGYELGDEDGETDAADEFEKLALEETEGQYGIDATDLEEGFHTEDLDAESDEARYNKAWEGWKTKGS